MTSEERKIIEATKEWNSGLGIFGKGGEDMTPEQGKIIEAILELTEIVELALHHIPFEYNKTANSLFERIYKLRGRIKNDTGPTGKNV